MDDPHDMLKAYIQRLLDLETSTEPEIGPDDLRRLAAEMGLDEAQWQALQAEAEAHLARGQGFAQYQNWDDAIGELEQALVIQPFRLEVLAALATAHLRRWEVRLHPEDRQRAEAYARRCLQQDPQHAPSLALLSGLRQSPAKKRPRPVLVWGTLAGLLIAVLAGVVLRRPSAPLPPPPETSVAPSVPPPAAYSLQTPLDWAPGAAGESLSFEARHSVVATYDSAYSYTLKGLIAIDQRELSQLTLRIQLRDGRGTVVHQQEKEVWGTHQPVLRDGDHLPVGLTAYVQGSPPPAIARAEVAVSSIEALPGQGPYAPSPALALAWAAERPANVDLRARLRKRQKRSAFGRSVYEAIALEVENTGQVSLPRIKASLRWYDAQDSLLVAHDLWVAATDRPALLPGEVRLAGGTYAIPAADPAVIDRLEVVVTEVDY